MHVVQSRVGLRVVLVSKIAHTLSSRWSELNSDARESLTAGDAHGHLQYCHFRVKLVHVCWTAG